MPGNTQQDAIAIKADRDGERPVVSHPDNDDLFVRTGRQVIEACRLGISVELWLSELASMLDAVKVWTEARSTHVRAAFCAPRGTRTVLFFIPTSDRFDFDLADELTSLNMELVNKFNIGMVEVTQIPWGELDRFLDPSSARQVYGG